MHLGPIVGSWKVANQRLIVEGQKQTGALSLNDPKKKTNYNGEASKRLSWTAILTEDHPDSQPQYAKFDSQKKPL